RGPRARTAAGPAARGRLRPGPSGRRVLAAAAAVCRGPAGGAGVAPRAPAGGPREGDQVRWEGPFRVGVVHGGGGEASATLTEERRRACRDSNRERDASAGGEGDGRGGEGRHGLRRGCPAGDAGHRGRVRAVRVSSAGASVPPADPSVSPGIIEARRPGRVPPGCPRALPLLLAASPRPRLKATVLSALDVRRLRPESVGPKTLLLVVAGRRQGLRRARAPAAVSGSSSGGKRRGDRPLDGRGRPNLRDEARGPGVGIGRRRRRRRRWGFRREVDAQGDVRGRFGAATPRVCHGAACGRGVLVGGGCWAGRGSCCRWGRRAHGRK
ncbi:unnamed protein product, partial [Ectocarpus sp. 8 AP-2014]